MATGNKNNAETILVAVVTATAFGLLTKYGLKKPTSWIVGAAAIGAVVGFFADSQWQARVVVTSPATSMPAASPVIVQPTV